MLLSPPLRSFLFTSTEQRPARGLHLLLLLTAGAFSRRPQLSASGFAFLVLFSSECWLRTGSAERELHSRLLLWGHSGRFVVSRLSALFSLHLDTGGDFAPTDGALRQTPTALYTHVEVQAGSQHHISGPRYADDAPKKTLNVLFFLLLRFQSYSQALAFTGEARLSLKLKDSKAACQTHSGTVE